jgi:hypothetical protein
VKSKFSGIQRSIDGAAPRALRKWLGVVCAFIVLAACLLPGTSLWAQFDSSQINGTIRDQSGAVIQNASIQIQNRDTGFTRQTVTNSDGIYVLSQIPPGVYKITAAANGFSSSLREGVELLVSQSATLDFALKPGSSTQAIEVSASSVELDTTSSTLGVTLETESVNNLPTLGRNYTALILLQPGVSPINDDETGNYTNPVGQLYSPSIQGFNNRSNTYLLDGVNNDEAISGSEIITPIPDDIQELKMVMHADTAQFGEGLGGTVNIITKSGTNQFHGAGWEFWRSSEFLDAPQFLTGALSDLHQNQFGGDVGGPVRIPFYNGKNRTFFYGSYEEYRQETAAQTLQYVPTAAEYTGDFSALLALAQPIQLYNPFTPNRDPFPNNQIPANLIDPRLVQYAKTVYPLPNTNLEGGAVNYLNVTPGTHDSAQYDIRGDEYLTKRDLVWAHLLHQNNPIDSYGGLPKLTSATGYVAHNFGAQWVHTFSPSSMLTVALGQNNGSQVGDTIYDGDVAGINSAAGFVNSFNCNYLVTARCVLPGITISNYAGAGEELATGGGLSRIWETKADYEKTIKRHTFFAGFNIDTNNKGQSASGGSGITFSPFQTSNGSSGGDGFASFLMSLPAGANRLNSSTSETGGWVDGFYAQDQWKIRDNLTINIGLRYDLSLVPIVHNPAGDYYDIYDFTHGTDVIQKMPPPCSATVFAPCMPGGALPDHVVVSSQPGKLFFPDKTNIQPRFGVSYALSPDTVIHAAIGRVYDNWAQIEDMAQSTNSWLLQTSQMVENLNTQPGLTPATQTTAQNPMAQFTGAYPSASPFGSVTWNTPPQTGVGYSDQWTFGVQQKVAHSNVWTINYVGAVGRKLDYAPAANTALTPGPGPVAPRTPFPYMGQSYYDQPIGKLNYNGLQTSFQGRNGASGLTYLVSYTYSKALNYGVDGSLGIGTSSIQNPYCFTCNRGVTGLDLTHVLTAGWVWEVPVGRGHFSTGNRFADYVVGNWQINGIATLESGQPFNIYDSGDIANTGNFDWVGGGYERPNVVGNPKSQDTSQGQWINPGAYATPAAYTYGDSGRNPVRTQAVKRLDSSLFREFPLFESLKLQMRLDAFNAFNHPVWGIPNRCQNCQFFGVSTSSVQQSREVQLSGKVVF